jgi:hypothetical protein
MTSAKEVEESYRAWRAGQEAGRWRPALRELKSMLSVLEGVSWKKTKTGNVYCGLTLARKRVELAGKATCAGCGQARNLVDGSRCLDCATEGAREVTSKTPPPEDGIPW